VKLPFSKKKDKTVAPSPIASGALVPRSPVRAARVPTLVEHCTELLSLAYSLRTTRGLGDPAEVRRRILRALEQLERDAGESGHGTHLIDAARFALVALTDESILSSQWPGRDAWRANPLQRELFKINVAGEEFYTRLDQLRGNLAENRPAVEVFYACLVMGFEGRYKLLGREKLEGLIQQLSGELTRGQAWKAENLSPAWQRPDEFHESVGEGIPIWMTVLGIAALVLILILIFRGVALHEASQAASSIRQHVLSAG
jgi:type VI secretion system protein ImpK